MRSGIEPPASILLAEDTSGNDPVYEFPTGIARDADLNALAGLRLPRLAVGQAQFIAADFSRTEFLPGLLGSSVDLTCGADGAGAERLKPLRLLYVL